jgi:hypothetical protein
MPTTKRAKNPKKTKLQPGNAAWLKAQEKKREKRYEKEALLRGKRHDRDLVKTLGPAWKREEPVEEALPKRDPNQTFKEAVFDWDDRKEGPFPDNRKEKAEEKDGIEKFFGYYDKK